MFILGVFVGLLIVWILGRAKVCLRKHAAGEFKKAFDRGYTKGREAGERQSEKIF